jgi:hypothetical protein
LLARPGEFYFGTIEDDSGGIDINLTDATYAPASASPNAYVADIQGLRTIVFSEGQETGLVQLRELLQKAGLRDLEREATYAIERGRTWHLINRWKTDDSSEANNSPEAEPEFGLLQAIQGVFWHFGDIAEGVFRLIVFEATTGYGLHPGRALGLIAWLWALAILVYVWPIHRSLWWLDSPGIYRIWSKDRIEENGGTLQLSKAEEVERLCARGWRTIPWAAYFSLLSAFHIGFREFNVGTWIARLQAHEYTLRATGWVRVVSGIQSLLSVYLLAIWALTYFGRPFQ